MPGRLDALETHQARGRSDGGEIFDGERFAELDIAHFDGEVGGDRLDGDGHRWLHPFLLAPIGPPNGECQEYCVRGKRG